MSLREEIIEEAEIIKDSGEIPEVAYWNSLYYLEEDPEGPKLTLTPEEKRFLKRAVIARYLFIIKRDLTFENIGKPFYRGLTRAAINWKRLRRFLKKEGFSAEAPSLLILEDLRRFLRQAASHPEKITLSLEEIRNFLKDLYFPPETFLRAWYLPFLPKGVQAKSKDRSEENTKGNDKTGRNSQKRRLP